MAKHDTRRRSQVAHHRSPGEHARPGFDDAGAPAEPMRIAKAIARAGLCSRREAERWIADGRVIINDERLSTPARDVGPLDRIVVDGVPLPGAEPARLWRYHKPRGLVTTHRDPEGRPTVFEALPSTLPRVVSVGRLDFNTEGLLLLTNDGELARHLELPATGWLRRYRVRALGRVRQEQLDALKAGIEIDGVRYGPVEATLDREQGANVWMTIGLREGKNREVRKILGTLALEVNRLIRISFGPFQLLDLPPGEVEVVRRRVLADQLGPELAGRLGLVEPPETATIKGTAPNRFERRRAERAEARRQSSDSDRDSPRRHAKTRRPQK
jgi:23S rRNA pseudouridine2605 synthase